MYFSFIIPVYNRPDEIKELLDSFVLQTYTLPYEIVIVEDGSSLSSEEVVKSFKEQLNIAYYVKDNSGPGDSRNYGMKKARGDYFIILDSDCLLPPQYIQVVSNELEIEFVDCFGGPDQALDSFSDVQKAINYAMTSVLTTGGVRGAGEQLGKFQPRSFNMGISKRAFEASGGFGKIHPGEDPDLTIRLWKLGYDTKLIPSAYVFHKRRIDWGKYKIQVEKFGKARPILNSWHPEYNKITYFFPSIFLIGLIVSILMKLFVGLSIFLWLYFVYFVIIFIHAYFKTKNFTIALKSCYATLLQFYGYGSGFLFSYFQVIVLKKDPKIVMPEMFFK